MIGTISGFVLLVIGIFITRVMIPKLGWGQWLWERLAAVIIVAGGLLGLTGALGGWFDAGFAWIVRQFDQWGNALFGQGVVGLIGIGLAVLWVMAFLPKKIANNDFPDWLIYAGFIIPSLLAAGSGPLVEFLQGIFQLVGESTLSGIRG